MIDDRGGDDAAMSVDVHPATTDDAVEIAGPLAELGYPIDVPQVESRLRVTTTDGHFVLVAHAGGEPVGILSAAAVPLLAEAAMMLRITSLIVTASARRRGVARMLVNEAERCAIDLGAASRDATGTPTASSII
jgi:GNAT superfamily N-acetyltransferase